MNQQNKLSPLTLVLGGQRSGKSAYGESLIPGRGIYLATCDVGQSENDDEMVARINAHKKSRGNAWQTVEEPLDIKAALDAMDGLSPVLFDSLGMWVSNMIHDGQDPAKMADYMAEMLYSHPAPVVVISDEVGLGLIGDTALGRSFVDALGALNQSMARRSDAVVMCVAGIPVKIK